MTPHVIKAIVDEVFAALEERFASKPFIHALLATIHVAADAMIPLIVSRLTAKGVALKS